MNNPTLTRSEFLEFLAAEFELPTQTGRRRRRGCCASSKTCCSACCARDVTPALIIDEAQSLPHELLEEIRLLANIETPKEKLLPIILAGTARAGDAAQSSVSAPVEAAGRVSAAS